MQIGVNNDPGLGDLLTSPQGRLILPPEYQRTLTSANVPANGDFNVMAGIGYLHKILARFGQIADVAATLQTPRPALPVVPAKPNTLHPAHAHHHHHLAPKQHLGIVGWRTFSFNFVAEHYNVGDGNYLDKLSSAYSLTEEIARASTSAKKP